jgi:hypothetical protein
MDSGNQQEHGQEVSSVVVDVTAGDYFELMVLTQGSDFAFQRVRRGSVFEMEVIG